MSTRMPNASQVTAWLFLAPALMLLGVFVFWPMVYLVYLSFTAGNFTLAGTHWVGLQNYWRLAITPDFWQVLGNTLYFTVATVIPSLGLPLALAVLLNQRLPLREVLRTAYFLPSFTSIVAAGLGFRWLFQTDGPVNNGLSVLGLEPIAWLGSTFWAMPVLIVLSIWKQLGFNMVVFLAGLQSIPRSRYEAAALDGAQGWQLFWHITLPGLRPTLIFAAVTTMIFTLRGFEQVYVVTGGGPLNSTNVLVYYIYEQAFSQFDFGYAAAAATLLLLGTLFLIAVQLQVWQEEP
ncbi:ABC transporter permease subunit [Synechococcales cyanobacterium C]|uniref:ABC transporter permease subunit n=1 Tax=Petrachloros mirabilis ULC683 TaxID=2781853 RepID=A0A8K2A8H8_9CYAN|nr:sugar ABC transporter permease [Petrachloros mirabilis]NCJ07209.1 ABC transporter permease subunit [Petrachloros mirabilis ULC683]